MGDLDFAGSVGLSSSTISQIRWGIPREPTWTDGAEQTSPSAGAILVTFTVSAGLLGRVFGISISSPDPNIFQLGIYNGSTFTDVKDFQLGAAGTIFVVIANPLINNVAAGSSIQVRIVSSASSSSAYQASILTDQG